MSDTYPSIALDGEVFVSDPSYRSHAYYDDETDSVPVSWALRMGDGMRIGGVYSTHAGAAVTIREFPSLMGAHIVPVLWRRHTGADAYRCRVECRGECYTEDLAAPLWPGSGL